MVKNKTGGNKAKGMSNKKTNFKPKTLFATEEGMLYCKILKKVGGTHMQVQCSNGKIMTAKIRGTMRKRKWINIGDIVLVSVRDFETNQDNCDILYCYDYDEAKSLVSSGTISFEVNQNPDEQDNGIHFGDDIGMSSDEDDPLNENSDEDVVDGLGNTNRQQSLAPIKTGKDMKSRNNKRDEKMSRIENTVEGDE